MEGNYLNLKNGVLIIEDHPIVGYLLKTYLSRTLGCKNIQVAHSKDETLLLLEQTIFDIVILDIMLEKDNGFEIARTIASGFPDTKIIILTGLCHKRIVTESVRVEAKGLIFKSDDCFELIKAIEKVLAGGRYFSSKCIDVLLDSSIESNEYIDYINRNTALTKREKEILCLILEELTVTEIADCLNISPRTVETYKKNLMAKFGVKTTVGLVKLALTKKLIEIDSSKG